MSKAGWSGWTLPSLTQLSLIHIFLLQSLKLAALTTAICIVVGYPFGYLMARLSPVARSVVCLLYTSPQKPSSIHIRNQHTQRIRTDANGCNPHSKHLVCICFGCLPLIA